MTENPLSPAHELGLLRGEMNSAYSLIDKLENQQQELVQRVEQLEAIVSAILNGQSVKPNQIGFSPKR